MTDPIAATRVKPADSLQREISQYSMCGMRKSLRNEPVTSRPEKLQNAWDTRAMCSNFDNCNQTTRKCSEQAGSSRCLTAGTAEQHYLVRKKQGYVVIRGTQEGGEFS